jgi:hypothetical protein
MSVIDKTHRAQNLNSSFWEISQGMTVAVGDNIETGKENRHNAFIQKHFEAVSASASDSGSSLLTKINATCSEIVARLSNSREFIHTGGTLLDNRSSTFRDIFEGNVEIKDRYRKSEQVNKSINWSAFRTVRNPMMKKRLLAEVDEISSTEATITFDHPSLGWYSISIPLNRFNYPLAVTMLVPIDVWFHPKQGVTQFRIPPNSALSTSRSTAVTTIPRKLPSEPLDFNDPLQLADYEKRLQEHFNSAGM